MVSLPRTGRSSNWPTTRSKRDHSKVSWLEFGPLAGGVEGTDQDPRLFSAEWFPRSGTTQTYVLEKIRTAEGGPRPVQTASTVPGPVLSFL